MALKESKYSSCLYYSSNALSRVLTKMADEAFQAVGLSPSYAFLLMTVNERPGIQPSEISRELELTPSTVTRLVEKMENRGFLKRTSVGRATKVEPLQKSLDMQGRLQEALDDLNDRCAEVLGDRYSEVLTEMTYTAVEKLE
ncbi:MAG: MarR family transcriptional regulator [Balneolaceae bacterium]|nr:MarR family transcriptional regulator [Balneolaceae bacterium]